MRGIVSVGAVAVALVLFFAVNILVGKGLGPVRLDLTEDRLYSLTDGAEAILEELDEPILAKLYFTEEVAKDFPPGVVGFDVAAFAVRVQEILDEFASLSDGKFEVEVIDPEPFSEEEDDASRAGLSGMPAGPAGGVLYLGLVLTNSVGDREVMAVLDGSRESFFEYELARRVHTLAQPEPPTIGLVTPLDMNGGQFDPMTQRPPAPPWVVLQQLRALFEVRDLGLEVGEVPEDVDALLVVHPKDLSDATRYAIDQFVLGGGPAIVFVDPQCLADLPPPDPSNPMSQYMQTPGASDLPELLRAWGVRLVPGTIAADRSKALLKPTYDRGAQSWEDYVVWMNLTGDDVFAEDEAAVGTLDRVWFAQAGELEALAGATTTLTPLVRTSEEAKRIPAGSVSLITQPDELLRDYEPDGSPITVAARLTGPASTAFPGGPPGLGEAAAVPADHRASSDGDIRVVVVSDVDMLGDDWCFRERRAGPISFGYEKLSDNGDLLLNVVEQLAGSENLIAIRGRGDSLRPFEVVEEIRRESDDRFREKEEELQEQLDTTNQRLRELQGETGDLTGVFITPQQQEEIDSFLAQKDETRKELRQLLHDKDRDIERLGMQLKLLNIFLVPLLVLGAGIVFWGVRISARRG